MNYNMKELLTEKYRPKSSDDYFTNEKLDVLKI